ncbi:hypothetical protein SDC9_167100 [bioreactor metagenome]|uniref:Uncharacterized protein n=1 Tax=bioreactor metagenome TaxID=1076179 RepID=A0A645FYV5_9ZZZZ
MHMPILIPCLTDLVVLAKGTAEVATKHGQRERFGEWEKVIERLLLNRVYCEGDKLPIRSGDQHPAFLFPNRAKASFALIQTAMVITEVTL